MREPLQPLQPKSKKPAANPAKRLPAIPAEPFKKENNKPKPGKPKPRSPLVKSRRKRWLLLFLFTVVLTMGTTVGLSIGFLNTFLDQLETITYLEDYRPWMPSRLFSGDEQNTLIATFFNERQNREMVPLSSMPKNLLRAVVDLEDRRFYSHFGISFPDIFRAAYINFKAGRIKQGASTLTIQLAEDLIKNKYTPYNIETLGLRSWQQKLWEMGLALKIEKRYSKAEILEIYLNQVILGGNNMSGVARAANYYFGKDIKELNLKECALFAGMLQAPSRFNPYKNPEGAQKRTADALNAMLKAGHITKEEHDEAINEPFKLLDTSIEMPKSSQIRLYPYFSEAIKRQFDEELIKSNEDTPIQVMGQGVDVICTIDQRLQDLAQETLQKGIIDQERIHRKHGSDWGVPGSKGINRSGPAQLEAGAEYDAKITSELDKEKNTIRVTIPNVKGGEKELSLPVDPEKTWLSGFDLLHPGNYIRVKVIASDDGLSLQLGKDKHVQGAMVIAQPSTGKVLALIGGYDFYDSQNNGQYIRAVQADKIQPGSSMKPLLYSAALSEPKGKWTPASILRDVATDYGRGWVPKNYYDRYFGSVTMRYSLAHSLNAASVWLLDNYKNSRGASTYAFQNFCRDVYEIKVGRDLSIALGTIGITPYSLAQAYSVLANRGDFVQLHMAEKVSQRSYQSDDNQVKPRTLYKFFQPVEKRLRLSPQVAYLTTYLMREVVMDGTAKKAKTLPFYCAGKTGTTDDCKYAWFTGYARDLLCVVYLGYDDFEHFSLGEKRTGSEATLPIWMDFMSKAYEIYPDYFGDVTPPNGITFRNICDDSGFLAGPSCPKEKIKNMPFIEGTEPKRNCFHGNAPVQAYKNPASDIQFSDSIAAQTNPNTLE